MGAGSADPTSSTTTASQEASAAETLKQQYMKADKISALTSPTQSNTTTTTSPTQSNTTTPTSGFQSNTTSTNGLSIYDKTYLSEADQQRIAALQAQYAEAEKVGDTAGMQSAHNGAEAIRASAGYSGGVAGDQYNQLSTVDYANAQAPVYQAQTIPEAQSYADYLKELYSSNLDAALAGYEGAYKNSLAELDTAASKIPAQYQAARNEAAGNYEVGLRNYAEYAAANGLNSGAMAQARLSSMNQYQGNLNDIAGQESNAMADLELQRTQLANTYQTQIAQAKAENNAQLAQALYNEYIRLDDAAIERAMNQSTLDFNTWQAMYQRYQNAQSASDQLASYGWQLLDNGEIPTADMLAAMGISATTAQNMLNYAQLEQLREAGTMALNSGVMPTDEQLAALGLTQGQALQILYNAGYGGGTSGGGSSSGSSYRGSSGSGTTSGVSSTSGNTASTSTKQTGVATLPVFASSTPQKTTTKEAAALVNNWVGLSGLLKKN